MWNRIPIPQLLGPWMTSGLYISPFAFHSEHSRKNSSEKEISLYASLRLDQRTIEVSKIFRLTAPSQKSDYINLLVLYFSYPNKIFCIMKHTRNLRIFANKNLRKM
jgi:hypothetical protein